jgi:LysM domain
MAKIKQGAASQSLEPTGPEATGGGGLASQDTYGNAFLQDQLRQGADADCGDHEHGPDDDVGGVRASAPTTKAAALQRHERNRTRVDRFIRSAMEVEVDPSKGFNSRANLLRNSAEWVDSGNATLYALTPTHDAHKRPSVPADQQSYFDTRVNYKSGGSDYDATRNAAGQATNDAGIVTKFSSVAGTMLNDGQSLYLIDPASVDEGRLATYFIHEVQHDADQHRTGEAWEVGLPAAAAGATTQAPQWTYNSYQTEFRAYWMMNPEGSNADWFGSSTDAAVTNFNITAIWPGPDGVISNADDVTQTVSTAFSNARQQDIFNHMYGGGRPDKIYWNGTAWTKSYAYLPYYYALDPAFKAMVDSYVQPASGNLVNSVRIQALSDAVATGDLLTVLTAADGLDDLDRLYLQNRGQSQPFWDQARAALGFLPMLVLQSVVDQPVVGPFQAETVEVVRGDTLSAIADRYLNDASRWPEIYRLNRAVIGGNPSRIQPGMVLQLPAM